MASSASRKGITPVIAIVLLLMMTVAAAGAAYSWFSQMQQELQSEARAEFKTTMNVKDLQCMADTDTIEIALKNGGSTKIEAADVDVFIRGSGGHLNSTFTDLDWSGKGFSDPGAFGRVTLNMADSDTGADFLVPGGFYKIEIAFSRSDYSFNAGGCVAES